MPAPVISFAVEPVHKGDEEKVFSSLRRLAEEDPSLGHPPRPADRRDDRRRPLPDARRDRARAAAPPVRRRGAPEAAARAVPRGDPPQGRAAQGRYKKQTGGRGQFGDCHVEIEPLDGHEGYEFVDKIVGGVIPQGFRPAVDKGIQEAMQHGELIGAPVSGLRVTLVDGSYHTVDSSEMAFKIAGSMAFKQAYAKRRPGAARADHAARDRRARGERGRRDRRHVEPPRPACWAWTRGAGGTVVHVEVPMAEVLTYAPDLTSMTGGRGDYSMTFLRYDEVPPHIAQAVVEKAKKDGAGQGVIGAWPTTSTLDAGATDACRARSSAPRAARGR